MKKITFLVLMVFVIVKVQAQNHKISFAGKGASFTVDSVQVENLTQCKSLSVNNGNDTLFIIGNLGINEISNNLHNTLRIYPNPMTGYCVIDFETIAQGETTISLYDIAGKKITQVQDFLIKGQHTYSLSGLGSGIYVLKVESAQYDYSAKIVSVNLSSGIAEIRHITSASTINKDSTALKTGTIKSLKGNKSLIDMQYTMDDTLKLTGFSGIYSTVVMLVPNQSQLVNFTFIACTDGDNNNYTIVQIGTQTWMEQNLKTTKYNNGTAIPLVTDSSAWVRFSTAAYCWYNDSIKYKNIYGALYNWGAVDTTIICPLGWHVPDSTEWATLIDYLGGYGIAGGKMKDTCSKYWDSPNIGATNSSGFTGLPGGYRSFADGTFDGLGGNAYWWSATEYDAASAWDCGLNVDYPGAYLYYDFKANGVSVRCVLDCPAINAPGLGTNTPYQNQIIWNWMPVSDAIGYKWNTTNNYKTATDNGMSTSYTQQCLTSNTSDTLYVWAYNSCFNSSVTTLIQNTTAFANCDNVKDYDGNVYNTVIIGTQCWIQQNLKTTSYNDGTAIPNVTNDTAWFNLITDGYCWYGDSIQYKNIYGGLYNWTAVNTGKLCPSGWHVPADSEWINLTVYLGGDSLAGGKLKEVCTAHWFSPNTGATNISGFTALPGGDRDGIDGLFLNKGNDASFWTSTEFDFTDSWSCGLDYSNTIVDIFADGKSYGFSVRCIKN